MNGISLRWEVLVRRRNLFELIQYRTFAELKAEAQRNFLGLAWWVLDPLMYLGVFYLVFGVWQIRARTDEFIAFLLVGIVHWRWFNQGVMGASRSLLSGGKLMQSVDIVKVAFPLTNILADTVKYLVILVLLMVALWLMGNPPTWAYLWLPALIVLELVLIMGAGFIFAAVMPFFPDLRFVISNLMVMLMFISGVFYSIDAVPSPYREYAMLNPLVVLLQSFRDVLIYNDPLNFQWLGYVAGLAVVCLAIGSAMLFRYDKHYPKLVIEI